MEKRVGIAELKARLSHYLRGVRRGRSLVVLDRDRPVARLVPVEGASRLRIRRRAVDAGRPGDLRLLPRLSLERDVVELLLEERGER